MYTRLLATRDVRASPPSIPTASSHRYRQALEARLMIGLPCVYPALAPSVWLLGGRDRERRTIGGRIGLNATETEGDRRAPRRIEMKEIFRRQHNSGARGREFESPRSDQCFQKV